MIRSALIFFFTLICLSSVKLSAEEPQSTLDARAVETIPARGYGYSVPYWPVDVQGQLEQQIITEFNKRPLAEQNEFFEYRKKTLTALAEKLSTPIFWAKSESGGPIRTPVRMLVGKILTLMSNRLWVANKVVTQKGTPGTYIVLGYTISAVLANKGYLKIAGIGIDVVTDPTTKEVVIHTHNHIENLDKKSKLNFSLNVGLVGRIYFYKHGNDNTAPLTSSEGVGGQITGPYSYIIGPDRYARGGAAGFNIFTGGLAIGAAVATAFHHVPLAAALTSAAGIISMVEQVGTVTNTTYSTEYRGTTELPIIARSRKRVADAKLAIKNSVGTIRTRFSNYCDVLLDGFVL
jgi:hypothetical protein